MKNLRYYLKKAKREGWAIGQFNFCTLEQLHGIVQASLQTRCPVILGTSEGESKFFGLEEAVALRDAMRKKYNMPIFLNLDHGREFGYVKKAIDAGYDMVHFDGSKFSIEQNLRETVDVVKYAKSAPWWRRPVVEGEVGVIATDSSKIYSERIEIKEENLTNPEEAKNYIKKTGVDLLAVSIGNLHGMPDTGNEPALRLDILDKIKTKVPLVLHGGSGVNDNEIYSAIKMGIVKININTELRLAYTKALKTAIENSPGEATPYKYLPNAIESVKMVVIRKQELFYAKN